ncbi:MAG: hypothetical protein WCV90_02190 [Candidatus Woesearchaeota archaeon]|jgi:hypothetical protein
MKRLWVVPLILLILLLSSCSQLTDENIIASPEKALTLCSKENGESQIGCYTHIAEVIRADNFELAFQACSNIQGDNPQIGCFQKIAEAQRVKDPELAFRACTTMPNPENSSNSAAGDCVQQLMNAQSNSAVKLSICQKTKWEDQKKNCIEELANEEKDPQKALEICNSFINDARFREHCYGGIEASTSDLNPGVKLSMCDSKTGGDKDNCYRGIAEEMLESDPVKSIDICNKIVNGNTKTGCISSFMSSPELVKAHPALAMTACASLSVITRGRCYSDLSHTLSASDPKQAALVCQKLSDDIQISDCYGNSWFAFDDKVAQNYDFDISLCDHLTLKRDDCLRRVSSAFIDVDKTKAEAICKLMSVSGSSGCLQNIQG